MENNLMSLCLHHGNSQKLKICLEVNYLKYFLIFNKKIIAHHLEKTNIFSNR